MPWPEKQRVAIYLDTKRRKGKAAAKKVMHEAGYGGGGPSRGHKAHDETHRRGRK